MSSIRRGASSDGGAEPRQAATGFTVAVNVGDRRLRIALYIAAVFLFWFAQYVFVPILPTYVQSKTTNLGIIGLALSMYGLWQAVVRLPIGIISDWLGSRKPFVLVGLALSGVGAWIMLSSAGVEGVAVGRAITGIAAGVWVLLVVAFSALFRPEEAVRASALLTLCNSLGRIAASAVAGPLDQWGGYALVFLTAVVVSLLSVLTLVPLREPRLASRPPSLGILRRLALRRDVMLPSILSALGQYVNWAISFGFLVVLVKQFGGDSVAQGWIVTVHLVMHATGSLFASFFAHRFGNIRLLYASFLSLAVGAIWAALANSVGILFVAPIFLGLGMGVSYPILMGLSIRNIAESERTTAMGLHQAIYAVGMFVGPAVSGAIADWIGIPSMFGITALALLVTAWSLIRILQQPGRKGTSKLAVA